MIFNKYYFPCFKILASSELILSLTPNLFSFFYVCTYIFRNFVNLLSQF